MNYELIQDELFREESVPDVAKFKVSKSSGEGRYSSFSSCNLYMPKIPGYLFDIAKDFFYEVSLLYDTEALLNLYYSPQKGDFIWVCPNQVCTKASVRSLDIGAEYDYQSRGYLYIGDFHSHGTICCSFSHVDDEDERRTGFYGVFYGFSHKERVEPSFSLRFSCGHYFGRMKKEDLFSGEILINNLPDGIYNAWLEKLQVL